MAVTQNSYIGNGSTTTYSFTFPYLKSTEIKASLDATVTTAFTTPTATTVQFNTAPANGVKIKIYRETDSDSLTATFYAGSAIKSEDLNDNFTQNLYATQEVTERYLSNLGGNMVGDLTLNEDVNIVFEGATDDAYETTLTVADPTADRTITLPNVTGTVITTGDTGTVATGMIAADAVNGTKIADDSINSEHYVDGSIDTAHIADAQITTAKLGTDSVTTAKITNANVTTAKIADANVTTAKIAADAITGAKIADDQIDSEHYVDGSIDHAHLSNDCIDGDNIQDDVVNSEHIAAGALDNEHYAAGSITSDKLSGAAVVTNSEQSAASVNDTSFFTTSASDARYFNISSGDTIKDGDTFPDNDTTIATTAAINDRIIDLVDDVGGFVPIANETSFPTANPDVNNGAGTLVSIKALASNLTSNGSGVATIANGAGSGNTVTINGLANSTTYAATFGMIVETTSTLHTYTFHRQVPKATEVTTVAGSITNVNNVGNSISNVNTVAGNLTNINTVAGNNTNVTNVGGSISNVNTVATNISSVNNFNDLYQIASSAPSTDGGSNSLAAGDLYFNTSANELKVYNGSAWQGGVTATGNLVAKSGDTLTGNLVLDNAKEVRLSETDANGSHYLGFKAPDSVTANVTLTLPDGAGSNGQYLKTNGSGTLSWGTISSTPEGTAVLSTGESGGTKFLREDGDNSCSWQTIPVPTTITVADESTDTSCNVLFTTAATGDLAPKTGTNLTFNSNTGILTATGFAGDITGNVTGNTSGSSGSCTGNAATATTAAACSGNSATATTATNASGLTGSPNITVGTIGCGTITGTSTISDSKGDVRKIIQNTQSTYSLVAADAGKHILASGTITVPNSTFAAGDAVTIVNNTSGNLTITASIGTLYNTADAATGNRTLAARGMATILFTSSTVGYISGAGLS